MKKNKILALTLLTLFMFMALAPGMITQTSHDPLINDPKGEHVLSAAPAIAANATVTNADDTDNLYARYKAYTLTANATDADGNIDHMNVSLIINGGAIQWTIKYDNTTDTFSEAAGAANVELVSGSSWANRTGTAVDLTISAKVEWAHSDIDNVILQTVVYDGTDTTTDNSSATFDVISSVAIVNSTISDSRGNPSVTNLNITGTVVYCNSTTNIKPPTAEADVWITSSAGNVSDLTLSSGVFSNASVPASSTVGLNTYTIHVVPEAGGVSGADQTNSTYTKTYISDQVRVTYLQVDVAEVQQGQVVNVYFNLDRSYDSSAVTSGTVTLNGYSAQYHSTLAQWYITVTSSNDQTIVFNSVVITGETYGITSVNMNSKSTQATWSGTPGGGGGGGATTPPESNNPFVQENPDGSVGLTSSGQILVLGSSGLVILAAVILFMRKK